MVLAATSSIKIAHAAFDAAVKQYTAERLTLRKGSMVLRDHKPGFQIRTNEASEPEPEQLEHLRHGNNYCPFGVIRGPIAPGIVFWIRPRT